MSILALRNRFNQFFSQNSEEIVRDSITSVGIKKQTGNLLNSVKYLGEVEEGIFRIEVGAEYASYLNQGYGPFVMYHGGIHPGWTSTWFSQLAEQKLYNGVVQMMSEDMNWIE
jgi:hypothetical protein